MSEEVKQSEEGEKDQPYQPRPAFQVERFKKTVYIWANDEFVEELLETLNSAKDLPSPVTALEADLDESLRPKGEKKKYRAYEGVVVGRSNGSTYCHLSEAAGDNLLDVLNTFETLNTATYTLRWKLHNALHGRFSDRKVA